MKWNGPMPLDARGIIRYRFENSAIRPTISLNTVTVPHSINYNIFNIFSLIFICIDVHFMYEDEHVFSHVFVTTL